MDFLQQNDFVLLKKVCSPNKIIFFLEQNNFVESTTSFVILTKHFCYHYEIIWLSETKNSTKKFGWSNKTFCPLYIKQIILLRQPNFCWHYQTVFSVYVCDSIKQESVLFQLKILTKTENVVTVS